MVKSELIWDIKEYIDILTDKVWKDASIKISSNKKEWIK